MFFFLILETATFQRHCSQINRKDGKMEARQTCFHFFSVLLYLTNFRHSYSTIEAACATFRLSMFCFSPPKGMNTRWSQFSFTMSDIPCSSFPKIMSAPFFSHSAGIWDTSVFAVTSVPKRTIFPFIDLSSFSIE